MLRDDLMQQIVSRDKEPITPFIERATDLFKQAGISTVLVAGSSGAYFFIADTVIQMDSYRPFDITESVKKACGSCVSKPETSAPGFALPKSGRRLASSVSGARRSKGIGSLMDGEDAAEIAGSIPDSSQTGETNGRGGYGRRGGFGNQGGRGSSGNQGGFGGRGQGNGRGERGGRDERIKVRLHGRDAFQVAKEPVDLRFVEQLADSEQTAALAQMVRYCLEKKLLDQYPLQEIVKHLTKECERAGLSVFTDSSYAAMGLCLPRPQEIYACLNRFRG